MNIAHFDDLLAAARQQPEPQRLLLVFATAELPADSTPEQAARFEAGQGGALVPLMCVDKTPEEVVSFTTLAEESQPVRPALGPGLRGGDDRRPGCGGAVATHGGRHQARRLGSYLPFNTRGEPVMLG